MLLNTDATAKCLNTIENDNPTKAFSRQKNLKIYSEICLLILLAYNLHFQLI